MKYPLQDEFDKILEVTQGTVLVDEPFPDEPPLEQIYNDLLIGDVETVAENPWFRFGVNALSLAIEASSVVLLCAR